jgi:glycine dehydrogenase
MDEQSMMRYLHKLQKRDYSLMDGMIPLGSCTMKHTPHEAMASLMDPKWNIHPYVPHDNTPHKPMIENLTRHLCKLSGFDHVFYQSQSGAMGEYAGLTTIRNYLGSKDRTIIIMPRSAHGTNAASCVLAGYKPVYINETSEGMIDMDHFEELLEIHKNQLAGLMITYPSTYGLYEPNARIINQRIHECGGQVYLDGANMNALVGMETPVADLGFDVCHFNLHKTFCIPHGGGGPGMGPIAVKEHLVDSLPSFSCTQQASSISTSPYGSGSLLVIPEHYVESQTDDDWVAHHAHLLETTKRVMKQLDGYYKIHHSSSPGRAHEFIIDTTPLKHTYKVTEVDICKRLMDYGFHGPTMSWPLAGGLMIEITETEPTEEVNRLVYALLKIHSEIVSKPELLRNAPHTQFDVANWSYDYIIGDACYPMKEQIDNKYWPTRNRVNDVYGDRNIMKK